MKKQLLSILMLSAVAASAQNVNIPDANFKAYLVGNTAINTNADTEIQVSEAQAFTGTIDCSGLLISNMTGIEAFTSLTVLWCVTNQFTSLDVSQNTALIDLRCSSTDITSIDVSNNTALEVLHVQATDVTSLDVSLNTSLTELLCHSLNLTSLDVTNNTQLAKLYCEWNQLTSLDVTQNTALTHLSCALNQFASLDVTNNTSLIYLNCSSNDLTSLDVSQNTSLTSLYISDNLFTSMNLTSNSALTKLRSNTNQLSSIDLSNNTSLTELYLHENQLTSLDVSQNSLLTDIRCHSNQLTDLNVANGNNSIVTTFYATDNPNLTCINVDDSTYSATNWTAIDSQSEFSEDCYGTASISESFDRVEVTMFPNPATSQLNIQTELEVMEVQITNLAGQVLLTSNNTQINIDHIQSGVYLVTTLTNKGATTQTLIKE